MGVAGGGGHGPVPAHIELVARRCRGPSQITAGPDVILAAPGLAEEPHLLGDMDLLETLHCQLLHSPRLGCLRCALDN